jgi:DNA adenine methylase
METSKPMMSSPIKWVGGKSKLRSKVIARLPADAECYAEVFAGAAWVLFGKPAHPAEVVNDKDGDLVNLWRVMKWRSAELLENVQQHLYSREWFYELRANKPAGVDEMERAVWMYLMIQMSFGADIEKPKCASFGCYTGKKYRLFPDKAEQGFEVAKRRLQNVCIENLDFADMIGRYDQKRTIFFCDPPYLKTCGYAQGFDEADHDALAAALRGIEGRFLLTINDHPRIRELYEGFRIEEAMEARAKVRASSGREAAPILFVSNYEVPDGTRA